MVRQASHSHQAAPSSVASRHLLPRGEKEKIGKELYFTSSTKGSSVARFNNAM
jgi:hypothetical protein